MELTQNDLAILLQCAVSAAMQAGIIINTRTGEKHNVTTKTGGSSYASQIVTEVDLLSQQCILSVLQPTIDTFDLGLLTEESTDDSSRFEKDYFWCIDPLDGTLPFTESRSGYSVSIALVSRSGQAYIGVIYDPRQQVLYYAQKGGPAYRNGQIWKWGQMPNNKIMWIMDRSFTSHEAFQNTSSFIKQKAIKLNYDGGVGIICHGGAAMNACSVLENAPACYFKFPRKIDGGGSLWDYAASSCILISAGAWVSDMFGNPLELNRQGSTFMNHNGILYASTADLAQQIIDFGKSTLI